jgi:predicted dehydrogenase
LRRVELTLHFPVWPRPWQQNSWINTREQGGFVFEVTGHFIQLIQQFFGPIHDVESELEFPLDPALSETGIMATMRLTNGVPITFNGLSGMAGKEEQHLNLTAYGTEGSVSLKDLMILKAGKIGGDFSEMKVESNHFWNELIHEFVLAIDGKPHDLCDFQVGYEVQKVLEALRKV